MKSNLFKIIIAILILTVFCIGIYFGLVNVKNKEKINSLQGQIKKVATEKNKLIKEKNDLTIQVDELQKQVDDNKKNETELLSNINKSQNQINNIEDDEIVDEIITLDDSVDTSDWLTYRNEEYGFEVKYPKDYIINFFGDVMRFYQKKYFNIETEFPSIAMRFYRNNNDATIDDWVLLNQKQIFSGKEKKEYTTSDFIINNQKSLLFNNKNKLIIDKILLFQTDKAIIQLSTTFSGKEEILIFAQMIQNINLLYK